MCSLVTITITKYVYTLLRCESTNHYSVLTTYLNSYEYVLQLTRPKA